MWWWRCRRCSGKRLLEAAGVSVAWVNLQSAIDIVTRCGKLVRSAIQARESEPCGGAGLQLDGVLRLRACLRVVAVAPAYFCEAGMRVRIVSIGL
jgi:hypothetical protein